MLSTKICERCLRPLPLEQFGNLVGRNDGIFPDPICSECRHISRVLCALLEQGRRRFGRWSPSNNRYLPSVRKVVTKELVNLGENATDFVVDVIAKLVISEAIALDQEEVDVSALFHRLFNQAEQSLS